MSEEGFASFTDDMEKALSVHHLLIINAAELRNKSV